MLSGILKDNPKAVLLFFVALSLLLWTDPFVFFSRDDWTFIMEYASDKTASQFFSEAHGSHVLPLFKILYYIEMKVFGHNAILYQIVSLIMWGIGSFALYRIFSYISDNNTLSLIVASIFCIHPNFGDIMYWIFQQGVIVHLSFQILTVLFYLKYIKSDTQKDMWSFLILLVTQNYFFGNGIFMPILFSAHYLYEKRKFSAVIAYMMVLQMIFVIVQKMFSVQDFTIMQILENWLLSLRTFTNLILVSVTRMFFVKQFGSTALTALSMAIYIVLMYFAFKKNKSLFLFGIGYIFFANISMSIARTDILKYEFDLIHYYYTILIFAPLFFIAFMGLSKIVEMELKINKVLQYGTTLYVVGLLLLNVQVKKIFSYKNFKNKEAINNAVIYGKVNYFPFDDGMYYGAKNIYQDNLLNEEVHKSLGKSSYFKVDSEVYDYIGERHYSRYMKKNNEILKSYENLKKSALFNIDINYERK